MSIIPAIRTHAQNRHYRRIANRNMPNNAASGTPIPGALTSTEIAHKARRRLRRFSILKQRVHDLALRFEALKAQKEKSQKLDTMAAQADVKALDHLLRECNSQLTRANTSLVRISG